MPSGRASLLSSVPGSAHSIQAKRESMGSNTQTAPRVVHLVMSVILLEFTRVATTTPGRHDLQATSTAKHSANAPKSLFQKARRSLDLSIPSAVTPAKHSAWSLTRVKRLLPPKRDRTQSVRPKCSLAFAWATGTAWLSTRYVLFFCCATVVIEKAYGRREPADDSIVRSTDREITCVCRLSFAVAELTPCMYACLCSIRFVFVAGQNWGKNNDTSTHAKLLRIPRERFHHAATECFEV